MPTGRRAARCLVWHIGRQPVPIYRAATAGGAVGGSFLFIHNTAPEPGPIWLLELRVLIAGLVLQPISSSKTSCPRSNRVLPGYTGRRCPERRPAIHSAGLCVDRTRGRARSATQRDRDDMRPAPARPRRQSGRGFGRRHHATVLRKGAGRIRNRVRGGKLQIGIAFDQAVGDIMTVVGLLGAEVAEHAPRGPGEGVGAEALRVSGAAYPPRRGHGDSPVVRLQASGRCKIALKCALLRTGGM